MALRAINNARVILPEGVLEGASVVLEGGRIAGVVGRPERSNEAIDAGGRYVLPGLVDLHGDNLEKQLSPRPGVEFEPEVAFLEIDRLFASSGITTGFHAIPFEDGGSRSVALGRRLYGSVLRLRHAGLARHELHLRCELTQEASVEAVEKLARDRNARFVSLMDHTPGQGQFRDLTKFKDYYAKHLGLNDDQLVEVLDEIAASGTAVSSRLSRVARAAREHGATLASHDDDSPHRVELLASQGVTLSEFPVNLESARRAKELGLGVCLGAPNAARGRSSGGNLSAVEAIRRGLVDALCSDYHPPSVLQAAFKLTGHGVLPLHRAVALVTSGPAARAGLSGRGEIREGAVADLVVVEERLGLAVATHTVVGGTLAFAAYQDNERGTERFRGERAAPLV